MFPVEEYRLRPLAEHDLDRVLQWRNSEHVRRNMFTHHIISDDEHRRWFDRIKDDRTSLYLIFENRVKPAGLVYFTDINRDDSTCIWGFYLGDASSPKGTGTVMGYLALNYIFETERLDCVCGEVLAFNTASLRFFRRLGFSENGSHRRHRRSDGSNIEVVRFSLRAEDWISEKKTLVFAILQANGVRQ